MIIVLAIVVFQRLTARLRHTLVRVEVSNIVRRTIMMDLDNARKPKGAVSCIGRSVKPSADDFSHCRLREQMRGQGLPLKLSNNVHSIVLGGKPHLGQPAMRIQELNVGHRD
jgi:hypothetical protein